MANGYLDPSILRLAPSLHPPPPSRRETITVRGQVSMWLALREGWRPGDRLEVSVPRPPGDEPWTRYVWCTVVSWDPEAGELVVDYDPEPPDPLRG